jgi:hypothetical protein
VSSSGEITEALLIARVVAAATIRQSEIQISALKNVKIRMTFFLRGLGFAPNMGGGNESIRYGFSDSRMPWPHWHDGRCADGGVAQS